MHRTGIEHLSKVWKLALLPLHQQFLILVFKSMNKSVHRTGIVLLSTSCKAAMLSLQQQYLNYAATMNFRFVEKFIRMF